MNFEKLEVFSEKKFLSREINDILASYYSDCRKRSKSSKIRYCAGFLQFKAYENEEQTRKLYRANFCDHPLCLMCAWRLSIEKTRELDMAVRILREQNPGGRFYFLTLTVSNWKTISKEKLKKLQKQGVEFIREVLGTTSYYVSLEITVGRDGLYHPHLHALVYTTRYIDTTLNSIATYRREWAEITRKRDLSYQILTVYPIVRDEEGEKNLHEVTKYILKPEMKITREIVIDVSKSIENVKKGFASGEVRKALKSAKMSLYERDREDLQKLEEYDWRIEFYRWMNNKYLLESICENDERQN